MRCRRFGGCPDSVRNKNAGAPNTWIAGQDRNDKQIRNDCSGAGTTPRPGSVNFGLAAGAVPGFPGLEEIEIAAGIGLLDVLEVEHAIAAREPGLRGLPGSPALRELGLAHQQIDAADRKSTRLNSSHSQISYAVFCLKKKKEA